MTSLCGLSSPISGRRCILLVEHLGRCTDGNGASWANPNGGEFATPSLQTTLQPDLINHPPHYTSSPATCRACGAQIECIDVVEHMGFCLGNVVKYVWRCGTKGGLEDLKKARWYLNREIERLEKIGGTK
jgi:Protein of unknwon function (DUF3310)